MKIVSSQSTIPRTQEFPNPWAASAFSIREIKALGK
jgi:hypothetical protein